MPFLTGLVLVMAGSVGDVERGEVAFRPGPEENAIPVEFRLDATTFRFEAECVRDGDHHAVWKVRFPSPLESPDPVNNTVHAEYFRPRADRWPGRRPGVVVLHILGADFALSRYLAARLADRGVAALFVKLPYYGERRPPGARFLSADMDRSMRAMRQGICDVRRAASWLQSRSEIDPERIGVAGISLGGIVSSVAASIDPKIRSAALLLAGGGLADILWDLPEPEARRYRDAWTASGRTRADLERMTEPYDPLTHAEGLRSKRVLMIAGNVDEVIPPSAATALWEKAGRPTIIWYDCGHYSAVGFLLPAIRETVEFFAAPTENRNPADPARKRPSDGIPINSPRCKPMGDGVSSDANASTSR